MKKLLIVESPAKAKTIAKYLGSDYMIRSSYGHICDLAQTKNFNLGIDIDNNFTPKYKTLPDKKNNIITIISAAKQASKIYIASDPDREGEAIAWHIAEILKKLNIPIYRVKFQEITKEAIIQSLKEAGTLDKHLYESQQARRLIDRIVGFMLSPILSDILGASVSAGRVQSIALKLVVDREKEIENFVPDPYWNISATLTNNTDVFVAKYITKITNEGKAENIYKDLQQDFYFIDSITSKQNKKSPPPPLRTVTLASLAASKYKFSTEKTMRIAQSLYEKGMITYMRTDSTRNSKESIQHCREWLSLNNHDIPKQSNIYLSSQQNVQDAHEAIRPTNVHVTPTNVFSTGDEQKIYTIIWNRFVASQMKPAIYNNSTIIIKTSSNHKLKVIGRILKYKGWLEIIDDPQKDLLLPNLKEKEQLYLTSPSVINEKKFTKPPPRFSEKTLVEELDKKGIGRPSTYANIMSKIKNKNYIQQKSNTFIPSALGIKIHKKLTNSFNFMQINYTSQMELDLDNIANGKLTYVKIMDSFFYPFKKELKAFTKKEFPDIEHICVKCYGPLVLKNGKHGPYFACYSYPNICRVTYNCTFVNDKPAIQKIQGEHVPGIFCDKCNAGMIKTMSKRDNLYFYRCSEYPLCIGSKRIT